MVPLHSCRGARGHHTAPREERHQDARDGRTHRVLDEPSAVLAFAVGMVRQLWHAGIAGWPDATLAIAVVLALPTLGALERVTPE